MLNPVWLQTFVTLIDTGHFTKTAEKLFMTQPGVSQHISKLEHSCGHSLINRDKKSFELTEQGRLVYQYAQSLKQNEHALLEQLSFDDPNNGQCNISCSGALALVLYPKLTSLQVEHPGIVLKLKAAPNHQIIQEVQHGHTDIGLVTHIPNTSLFDVVKLGEEELCLAFAKQNIAQDIITLIKNDGLIDHPDAEHYLSLFIEQSHDNQLSQLTIKEIKTAGFINQISQILEPVAKGLGFTVLPKSAIDSFAKANQLSCYQSTRKVMEPIYLITRKNRQLPARFQQINTILAEHFT